MKVVSTSDDDITNFHFADDTVVNAKEEGKAGVLLGGLDATTTMYRRSRKDESDDKQHKWLPKGDQDERSEARSSGEIRVTWSNHLQRRIKSEILSILAQTTAALSSLKII